LVDRYYDQVTSGSGPVIVYISPTKALINDLVRRLERPCAELGISVAVRHGDRSDLTRSRPPGVLITTPESLDVLLARADGTFAAVAVLILDEIHLLYNSQRGLQTAILIHRLEQRVGRTLQVVGMSASVADPNELVRFVFGGRR